MPNYNLYIEYDGRQHFKSVKHWGGTSGLKKRQERDLKRNQWCKENNVNLLIITYLDNIEDKLLAVITPLL